MLDSFNNPSASLFYARTYLFYKSCYVSAAPITVSNACVALELAITPVQLLDPVSDLRF